MTPTTAPTSSPRRSPLLILGGLLAAVVLALLVFQPPSYTRGVAGDPENPEPDGTMAVVEVLRTHGTEVKVVRSVSTALATPTDLLVISKPHLLTPRQSRDLAESSVDTVLIGATRGIPGYIDNLTRANEHPTGVLQPGCEDERAGAGKIRTVGPPLAAPGATACFSGPDAGVMLTWETEHGGQATILPQDVVRNRHLLEESNAALSVRVLGSSPQVTWLVASSSDPYGTGEVADDFSLTWLWAAIASVFIAAIWWRGPRFGKLTSEPLPVVVNSSETVFQMSQDVAEIILDAQQRSKR